MMTPMYACRLNVVPVSLSAATTPMAASGTENMMMNGSRSDSYCDAMTAYTRRIARISTHWSCWNAWPCASTSAPKPAVNSCGTRSSGNRALMALTASLSATCGSDVTRTMRSWFLRWISVGPVWLRNCKQVLRLEDLSLRRADQDVVDVVDAVAIFLAQPHDDRVLVAVLSEERRLRAADARPDAVGDVAHAQPEERGLRPIDQDRELGPAVVAADPHVADFRHPVHDGLRRDGQALADREVVAADFERQTAVAAATATTATAAAAATEQPRHRLVAAGGARRDDDARDDAGELPVQRARDLLARARALGFRHEANGGLRPARAAAAEPAAASRLGDDGVLLLDVFREQGLETRGDVLRALDARAHGQFRGDLYFSFVRDRHQLEADGRKDEERHDHEPDADAEHGRPVVEGTADQAAVPEIHVVEEPLARTYTSVP